MEGAKRLNDFTNWLKHGETHEKATISELEVITTITRAVSKFKAVPSYETTNKERHRHHQGGRMDLRYGH
jgi:hypothetical protein